MSRSPASKYSVFSSFETSTPARLDGIRSRKTAALSQHVSTSARQGSSSFTGFYEKLRLIVRKSVSLQNTDLTELHGTFSSACSHFPPGRLNDFHSSTLSFTSALYGGGCFTPGNETRYPTYRNLGGPQGRAGRVRKISPSPGFDSRTVYNPYRVAIPTELITAHPRGIPTRYKQTNQLHISWVAFR